MNLSRLSALTRLSAACLALFSGAAAQTPEPAGAPGASAPVPAFDRSALYGVQAEDGGVVALGPDYKAHIRAGAVAFTPALGAAVDVNQTWTYAFEEVLRGGAPVARAAQAPAPGVDGDLVRVAHGAGVVERYRVSPEGLHLSYVIPARPAGQGDLIVRARVDSVLPAGQATAEGGLAFTRPGVGGVRFGAVTGVDANGATMPGEVRLDGDRLDLVLPADFVDSAAYPLVVDPLIGPELAIDDSIWEDTDVDVASSTVNDGRYCAVWTRSFSVGDTDVRAQRLDVDGNPVGFLMGIESGDAPVSDPKIAHVLAGRRYLIVWQEQPSIFQSFNIMGRAVDALDGGFSGILTIAATSAQETDPDVAGERSLVDDDAFVVWDDWSNGIMGQQVTVPISGAPFLQGSPVQIADDFGTGDYDNPAISDCGGDEGRYLLAWETGLDDILYRLIGRNGNLIGGAFLLGAIEGGPHRNPACASHGDGFMMVWERGEDFTLASTDVYALSLSYSNGNIVHNAWAPVENNLNDDESDPVVVTNGQQFLVSYVDQDTFGNVYAKSVDPFTCLVGELEELAGSSTADQYRPALASVYSAGLDTDSRALLAWHQDNASSFDIFGHAFDSPFGQIDLGGGCGTGGVASTPLPYDGNDNFAFHLREAEPLSAAILVFAFQTAPFSCGPCTVFPSFANPTVVFPGLTDQYGSISAPIALPSGVSGATFWSQWSVASGESCDLFGVDLSNGVETTIQL